MPRGLLISRYMTTLAISSLQRADLPRGRERGEKRYWSGEGSVILVPLTLTTTSCGKFLLTVVEVWKSAVSKPKNLLGRCLSRGSIRKSPLQRQWWFSDILFCAIEWRSVTLPRTLVLTIFWVEWHRIGERAFRRPWTMQLYEKEYEEAEGQVSFIHHSQISSIHARSAIDLHCSLSFLLQEAPLMMGGLGWSCNSALRLDARYLLRVRIVQRFCSRPKAGHWACSASSKVVLVCYLPVP